MAWGGCIGAAGYPMGCRPLKFPNLIVLLTRFGHPRGSPAPPPPRLDLAAAETSSYRDTANLGLGVRPRGAAHWVPGPTGDSG